MLTKDEEEELKELYEIITKSFRRCVRDMRHMLDDLKDNSIIKKEEWRERLSHYENILNGTCEYRIKLHMTIWELEFKLQQEINKKNNPPQIEPDKMQQEIPF